MITAILGDTLVTMITHQVLSDDDDEMQFHHTLLFRDMPTGRTAEISYAGENDAVMAFAAWLVSDEEDIESLDKFRKELYERLPKGFLP